MRTALYQMNPCSEDAEAAQAFCNGASATVASSKVADVETTERQLSKAVGTHSQVELSKVESTQDDTREQCRVKTRFSLTQECCYAGMCSSGPCTAISGVKTWNVRQSKVHQKDVSEDGTGGVALKEVLVKHGFLLLAGSVGLSEIPVPSSASVSSSSIR